ncbi:peptidoglycan-recognition SC2-like [Brachionus plicatilis]|uniref:Peptidoglycan-recognition protein n=1 Tax=Brachionus plicatilis TaxID=10195 RepID=A0A3M7QIL3_BRAPC|nr:peptidoglycan-recognition SC2-like [Brachionus plicatilis]
MINFTFLIIALSFSSTKASCPNIVSRAEWGARAPIGSSEMSNPVPYVVIHHGATAACATKSSCINLVKSYQILHMDTNKWDDIGYSFIVGEDGNVYEGRGWSRVGAHAPGFNTNSIGICIIGDFTSRLPNSLALNAVKNLIECGVSLGKIKPTYSLRGHRDSSATECPGNTLYTEIRKWAQYGL